MKSKKKRSNVSCQISGGGGGGGGGPPKIKVAQNSLKYTLFWNF